MNCPKCKKPLFVTHTFDCDQNGQVQRRECKNGACGTIVVSHALVLAVDPTHGQGARAVAKRFGWAPKRQIASAGAS